MNDPLRRFKSQPWKPLSLIALTTVAIVSAIDYLLIFLLANSEPFRSSISFLFSPPLGMLIPLAVAGGIGILGVYICDQFRSQVFLNAGSLWALVLCLVIALALTGLLPLPSFLVQFSYPALLGIMVGVFWKGRRYWR
ncbi:hypothetical protein [Dactylococcopsis salina]|uniref:Peptide chain release factor 1 n=1 Tax=Dactylococcopsis salina (strain PCC 8305) TaxID=13035 RepID=K9YZM1_DACS8|nr:hypothetical protein [Dactylococcopsis salina]AFZ51937.1 hypothetical protein Dacsa_3445 [Dactylococcopsis salina PCC 8305]